MRKVLGLMCMVLAANSLFGADTNKNVIVENVSTTPTLVSSEVKEDGLRVRTLADIEKGKVNVNNVVKELKELFSHSDYTTLTNVRNIPLEPAYFKVVKNTNGTSTLVYRPRFTSSEELYKSLNVLASRTASMEDIEERNMIIISDKDDYMTYYKELIDAVDIPSPQVLIEAKIVEVSFSDGMQRNLSFGFNDGNSSINSTTTAPGATTTSSGLNGNFTPGNFDISFKWLLTAEDAKVISSPNILVTKNEIARIVTAEEIPIQEANTVSDSLSFSTTFKRVGVTLEVEPQMINNKDVTLRVFPQISNVLSYEEFPVGSDGTTYPVPTISIRSIESYLRMHDQQVVMLGGLYSSSDTLQQERIPILSDIPILGEIFTGKNKVREIVQLIFFIKTHIIPAEAAANDFLYNPNDQAIQSEKLANIVNNPEIIPDHEKGVVTLVDEMIDSADNSFISEKGRLRKENSKKIKDMQKSDSEIAIEKNTENLDK